MRSLLAPIAIVIAAQGSSLAADRTYVNARFGTSITFSDAIFTKQDPEPANGDGLRWRSSDGAELAVWGEYNALDFTPQTLADFVSESIEMVTYRKVGASWMVVSGFDGETIVYRRAEFGRQDVIHSFELRYPKALGSRYDRLAAKIADSLVGP